MRNVFYVDRYIEYTVLYKTATTAREYVNIYE